MTYQLVVSPQAAQDVRFHKASNPAAYAKLLRLFLQIASHPRTGIGKPEPLRNNLSGLWSRRITDRHRLVYEIDESRKAVYVLSAAGHYGNK